MFKKILIIFGLMLMPVFGQDIRGSLGVRTYKHRTSHNIQPSVMSAVGYGDDIITHIVSGSSWKTSITLMNLSETKSATFVINFYGDSGSSQVFKFVSGLSNPGEWSELSGTLPPSGSIILQTSGSGNIVEGWGQFDYENTTDSIGGFAIFSNANGSEAAVPFETDLSNDVIIPYDNTQGFGMGMALANAWISSQSLLFIIKDAEGNVLGVDTMIMSTMSHTSFIFTQKWPFSNNHTGVVVIKGAIDLAVLGLRFTPKGNFTSVTSFQTFTID